MSGKVALSVSQVPAPSPEDFKQVPPKKKHDLEGEKEPLS